MEKKIIQNVCINIVEKCVMETTSVIDLLAKSDEDDFFVFPFQE